MRIVIYALSSIFLLIGCKGQVKIPSESVDVSNIIDLAAGFDNIHSVRLSEIADSVTFIPFETTSNSLMGVGQNHLISFSPSYIFYWGDCFDWNGKHWGKIVKNGQGPYEELDGGYLVFKDNHFYSEGSKFIEYDITGQPTGKVRNLFAAREFGANDFLRQGVVFTNIDENFMVYNYPNTIYFIDKNFETVASRNVFLTDSLTSNFMGHSANKFITYYKDMVLFYNFVNDTIFRVLDTGLEPRWIVSFDHPARFPTQVMLKHKLLWRGLMNAARVGASLDDTEVVKLEENKHRVLAAYETESHVFFFLSENIGLAEVRNKIPPDPSIIYYDKNTGKSIRVKGKGFVDDLLGMDFFYPQLGIFEQKMITYIWPYELLEYIDQCKEKGRDVNPQLLVLSKTIDPEDNPILILAHLKKNI